MLTHAVQRLGALHRHAVQIEQEGLGILQGPGRGCGHARCLLYECIAGFKVEWWRTFPYSSTKIVYNSCRQRL